MRFIGQLQGGIYDDCQGVPEHVIEQFYGTHGNAIIRSSHQTGAGHPPDEDGDEDWVDVDEAAETSFAGQETLNNVYVSPVPVPRHQSPFTEDERVLFDAGLFRIRNEGRIPLGYGAHPSEWPFPYPPFEDIPVGRVRGSTVRISLPNSIWLSRSQLWAQALYLLTYILDTRA